MVERNRTLTRSSKGWTGSSQKPLLYPEQWELSYAKLWPFVLKKKMVQSTGNEAPPWRKCPQAPHLPQTCCLETISRKPAPAPLLLFNTHAFPITQLRGPRPRWPTLPQAGVWSVRVLLSKEAWEEQTKKKQSEVWGHRSLQQVQMLEENARQALKAGGSATDCPQKTSCPGSARFWDSLSLGRQPRSARMKSLGKIPKTLHFKTWVRGSLP